MDIHIHPDFEERDLALNLGLIRAGVEVRPSDAALLTVLAEASERRIAAFAGQPASSDPQIAATRKAYKALGKDPARYRPAAEALTRRVLQGKGLFHVNNLVDVNNLLSLSSGISIGTYRCDKIVGDITFRRAQSGESYSGIGRGPLNLEGLPVFCDEQGPFGSPTSDSERTMITDGSCDILMILICFGAAEALEATLTQAATLLHDHCAARDFSTDIVRTQ